MRRAPAALLLALVLSAGFPGALGSHANHARNMPLEHDDFGRSDEPDFAATSVLAGGVLGNCVVDAPPLAAPRACGDDAARTGLFTSTSPHAVPGYAGDSLAPGCTADDGAASPSAPRPVRVPSGFCGLWTVGMRPGNQPMVPPGVAGEDGMRIPAGVAPGAFSPSHTTPVAFLDGSLTMSVLVNNWVPLHRRFQDSGLAPLQPLASSYGPTYYAPWAWFGTWRDLNGNGVIDHVTPGTAGPTANEFTWLGSCTDLQGLRQPSAIVQGLCEEAPNPNSAPPGTACGTQPTTAACAGTTLHLWMYPGNHHGGNYLTGGGAPPAKAWSDLPGNQALNFVARGGDCASPPTCDDDARADTASGGFGDPLLDVQDEVVPDDALRDRTGSLDDTERRWVGFGGVEGPAWDDGLVTATLTVFGANCAPAQASPARYDLGSCTFRDVDHHTTASPLLDAMLGGATKPLLRSQWEFVVAATPSMARALDAAARSALLDQAAQGPLQGAVNDALLPGWSREPNHPGDAYVGVAWAPCAASWPQPGEARHRGWCNAPAPAAGCDGAAWAYACYGGAEFRGWLDAHLQRNAAYMRRVAFPSDPCTWCGTFPVLDLDAAESAEGPDAAHQRALPPGAYYVKGVMGRWRDGPHAVDETLFPGPPAPETYPADGWVGFLARSTGQWRYRGYADQPCATEKDAGAPPLAKPAAECNPYLDGRVEDPQDLTHHHPTGAPEEEWQGACSEAALGAVTVAPEDGAWDTDVLVWRNHHKGIGPLLASGGGLNPSFPYGPGSGVEVIAAGSAQPITMQALCFNSGSGGLGAAPAGAFVGSDYLIWVQGSREAVRTTVTAWVDLGLDLDGDGLNDADTIVDVDAYRAWA